MNGVERSFVSRGGIMICCFKQKSALACLNSVYMHILRNR